MKYVALLAATLILCGYTTARPLPPAGNSFELVTRDHFGLEVLMPRSRQEGRYHGKICSFDVESLGRRVVLGILVYTVFGLENAHEFTTIALSKGRDEKAMFSNR